MVFQEANFMVNLRAHKSSSATKVAPPASCVFVAARGKVVEILMLYHHVPAFLCGVCT